MNILTVTSLYPNKKQFRHGIFIETRLRQLLQENGIQAKVVAPVPWFPFKNNVFKKYAFYADIPKYEERYGIGIYHPRYLVIPKVGMLFTPFFMAFSLIIQIKKLQRLEKFDLIDAHYYYPDGVAVSLVSKLLHIPFFISARGSDINLITNYKYPKKMILWAANNAKASITVSKALKDKMVLIGAKPEKIHVLRNGIDLKLFRPLNKLKYKKKFRLGEKVILSIGNLVDLKGHDLIIDALRKLPDFQLIIVGMGEEENNLKKKVTELSLENQVLFLGERQQTELVEIYTASDVMVLASSREGWPNVVLESLACGTPVVATTVGGTPEILQQSESGVLIERSSNAIAEGIINLFEKYPNRDETRKYSEKFSWESTTQGLLKLFKTSLL